MHALGSFHTLHHAAQTKAEGDQAMKYVIGATFAAITMMALATPSHANFLDDLRAQAAKMQAAKAAAQRGTICGHACDKPSARPRPVLVFGSCPPGYFKSGLQCYRRLN
jgi:hypothetical protein